MRDQRTWLWLVLLLGMAARTGLGIVHPEDFTTDNDGYLAHARPVAAGEGFLGPYSHQPTAFRPPAYPMALGILIRCGMSESAGVAVVNGIASIFIVLLTWKLALQIRLPTAFALLSALVVALDPLLVRYATLPMTEVPCAAILLAAVICFRHAMTNTGRAANVRSVIMAGILFGTGTLIRPVLLVACVFLTLHALFRPVVPQSHAGAGPAGFRLLPVLLPVLIAAATLAPWTVRNAIQFHRFIPATTHGGYTLALGNNPDFYRDVINGADTFPWDAAGLTSWQQRMISDCEKDGVTPGDEPATDAWYYRKAMEAIRAGPASFLKATVLRMQRFWALSTADTNTSRMAAAALTGWYATLWIGLAIQFFGGMLNRNTEQSARLTDLWLIVLSFVVIHSVYWTDTRMRAPLMPILCVLSMSGWCIAYNAIAGRKYRSEKGSDPLEASR